METHPDAHKPHPTGLYVLFFAEMWERFSYYGMRAMLVLYMTARTKEQMAESGQVVEEGQIGLGWTDAEALGLYGTYTMLVYITPILGGWFADNVLGQRKAIVLGGLLMCAGHFLMAYTALWAFYTALGLIIVGNGFFKPNISTMVGQLYKQGDPRRDSAFTIFYIGINAGAFLAPIVCGQLRQSYGFHYGFAAAGFGMLLGQLVFQYNPRKFFGDIGTLVKDKVGEAVDKAKLAAREAKQRYDQILGYRIYAIICMVAGITFALFTIGNAVLIFGTEQQYSLTVKVKSAVETDYLVDQAVVKVAVSPEASGASLEVDDNEGTDSTLVSDHAFLVGPGVSEGAALGQLQVNPAVRHAVSQREGEEVVEEERIDQTDGKTFVYEILDGNVDGMFALDRQTGRFSIVKPELMASHYPNAMFGGGSPGAPIPLLGLMAALTAALLAGFAFLNGKVSEGRKSLSQAESTEIGHESERILVLFILAIFNIFFWAGFEQAGGLMNIYADRYTDRVIFGYEIPTEAFQSVNAFFIVTFGVVFTWLWGWLNRRGVEPNTPLKFGFGLILLGVGFLFMLASSNIVQFDDADNVIVKAGMSWVVLAYLFHTWGELCLSPVGLSMVTKLAPAAFGSLLMGIWFFSFSMGNKLAGVIGQFSESLGNSGVFLSIAAGEIAIGLVMVALSGTLHKLMHGRA